MPGAVHPRHAPLAGRLLDHVRPQDELFGVAASQFADLMLGQYAGVALPAAASVHSIRALRRTGGIAPSLGGVGVLVVPVEAPLGDVAVHVVQPEAVRLVGAYFASAARLVVAVR